MTERHEKILLSEEDQAVLGELDDREITPEVKRHAANPHNFGIMSNPDGQAVVKGICEDTVSIQLRLVDDKVEDIRFECDGCGFTRACGSAATELTRGKSLGLALEITGQQISGALGGLPRDHTHCADLAANAVRSAAVDATERSQCGGEGGGRSRLRRKLEEIAEWAGKF